MLLTRSLRHYPFTAATLLAVVVLSLAPIGAVEIAQDVPFADKWTHMVMYGGLCAVWWSEYALRRQPLRLSTLCWATVLPVAVGGLMELLQAYATTYRSGEWLDFAADSAGVLIGTLLGLTLQRLLRR